MAMLLVRILPWQCLYNVHQEVEILVRGLQNLLLVPQGSEVYQTGVLEGSGFESCLGVHFFLIPFFANNSFFFSFRSIWMNMKLKRWSENWEWKHVLELQWNFFLVLIAFIFGVPACFCLIIDCFKFVFWSISCTCRARRCIKQFWEYFSFCHTKHTVLPRIIAGGDYFFFRTKRGRLFEGRRLFQGGNYFKYCSLEVVP